MSRKKRDLSEEELTLWRRVASSVKPRAPTSRDLAEADRWLPAGKPLRAPPPSRAPRAAPQPKRGVPPAERGGEKRVRRGKIEIDAILDLHGHTQESGRAALARFVHAAHRRGERTLIVITGAGRTGEGVLKRRLPDWLAELTPPVSGYAQAHRQHGGAGAFYVFLRRGA